MRRARFVLMALMLVLSVRPLCAQSIRVLPVTASNVSGNATEMLYNRLSQAVSLNGMASTDNSNRFLLMPSVTVASIEPTVTVPVQYIAEVEIVLSLVDNSRKMLITQEILTKKGIAENETKAVNEAIGSLKGRDAKLKKLIVNGKKEILEYYNTECESVVATITKYIEMGMYDEALNELNAIPQIDAELDCYGKAVDVLSKISAEQQAKSNDNIRKGTPDVSWVNE